MVCYKPIDVQKDPKLIPVIGSTARIGPNLLLTSDEDLIRKMAAVRSTYSRADWYRAFKFDADRENLFSEPDEEKAYQNATEGDGRGSCFLTAATNPISANANGVPCFSTPAKRIRSSNQTWILFCGP